MTPIMVININNMSLQPILMGVGNEIKLNYLRITHINHNGNRSLYCQFNKFITWQVFTVTFNATVR